MQGGHAKTFSYEAKCVQPPGQWFPHFFVPQNHPQSWLEIGTYKKSGYLLQSPGETLIQG